MTSRSLTLDYNSSASPFLESALRYNAFVLSASTLRTLSHMVIVDVKAEVFNKHKAKFVDS